jgi:pyridoxal phosphate enzyme (YggS family)
MIKDNILKLRERVDAACAKVGRKAQEVTIVAVSKNRTAEEIAQAFEAGITDMGENKVQEAIAKNKVFSAKKLQGIKWHMVGHLQSNKVRDALKIFDLIHSVDSEELAAEIDKQAARLNEVQDILLQVNTSGEESKFGLRPESLMETFLVVKALKNVSIKGLMTIAPLVDDPEKVRLYFRRLKELRDRVYETLTTNNEQRLLLSMGMSDDFEVALEEGADILRIGRAIYE